MIIGIDAGGSKTHAVLSIDGVIVNECITGCGNIHNDYQVALNSIGNAIDFLLMSHPNKDCAIKIGVAGYSDIKLRNRLQVDLNQKYSNVKITSDAHIACLAAHKGESGGVLICGTGVVGYINLNDQQIQLGGFGFPHGDLGGGAYIGLEISRLLCKSLDGIIPFSPMLKQIYQDFDNDYMKVKYWLMNATVADYASIAKIMFKYTNDDSNAKNILMNAINEVNQLLVLMYKYNVPIKLYGGLAEVYLPYLNSKFIDLGICQINAAIGAVYL